MLRNQKHQTTAVTCAHIIFRGIMYIDVRLVNSFGALTTMSDPYQVKVKGGEVRNRILLRSFDKGLLVRSPADERVEFIKWDQIEEVTKPSPTDRGESYSCQWFAINCTEAPIIP